MQYRNKNFFLTSEVISVGLVYLNIKGMRIDFEKTDLVLFEM